MMNAFFGSFGSVLLLVSLMLPGASQAARKGGGSAGSTNTAVAPASWLFVSSVTNVSVNGSIYYNLSLYGSQNTSIEFFVSEMGATPRLALSVPVQDLSWKTSTCFGNYADYSIPGLNEGTAYAVYARINKGGKVSSFISANHVGITESPIIGGYCSKPYEPYHANTIWFYNTNNSIYAEWSPPTVTVAKEYRIYLATGDTPLADNAPLIPVGSTTSLNFQIPNLEPWKKYCFAVSVVDLDGVESLGKAKHCTSTMGPAPAL